MKTSAYIATSLDGFIARPDGGLDWLDDPDADGSEDYGYQEFIDSVDVLVMGRKSFEKVLSFGAWSYGDKPVVVLSSGTIDLPAELRDSVSLSSEKPAALVRRLAAQGAAHLYIDGGKTIQGFLAAGWIDEITITRIPVLLGQGIPLFGPLVKDVRLAHVATQSFGNGYVQSKYRVVKAM